MNEKEIVCKTCGQKFFVSEEELQWYAERDFVPPKNCRPCRRLKRDKKPSTGERRNEVIRTEGQRGIVLGKQYEFISRKITDEAGEIK